MVAPATGWALVDQHLFWTSNDGKEWRELTPGTSSQHIDGVFFRDTSNGWVVLSQRSPDPRRRLRLTVAETHDAGISWTVSPVGPTSSDRFNQYAQTASIFFLDDSHGWLSMRLASSSNFSFGLLFTTQDGGETWAQLPDPPAADPVYFLTPTRGWIAGGPGGDKLWMTQDGGKIWQEQGLQQLSASPNCTPLLERPRFDSLQNGVLPLSCRDGDRLYLGTYATSDSGQSWQAGPAFERGDTGNATATAVVDGAAMRVFATSDKIVTRNNMAGGINASLPSLLWPSGVVAAANFASAASGWILYSAGKCLDFKSNCSQQNELLSTADAGRTYSRITPATSAPRTDLKKQSRRPVPRIPPVETISAIEEQAASGTQISQGEGFDQCQASTVAKMQTWWGLSPYTVTGIYIGGENEGCPQPNITSDWVTSVTTQGWGLLPIWVGKQAPILSDGTKCSSCTGPNCKTMDPDPTISAQQGKSEADAAVSAALALGINESVIYYDMEQYTDNLSCSAPVTAFLNAWVQEININPLQFGFEAAAYGAPTNASADWSSTSTPPISNPPSALWFAAWDNKDSVLDPVQILNTLWPNHQRVHQFCSDGTSIPCTKYADNFGMVKFSIDGDVLDGPVVPSQAQLLPPPALQSPSNGAAGIFASPTFIWSSVAPSYTYRIAVATTPSALPIASDALSCSSCAIFYPPFKSTLTTTSYTPASGILKAGTTYYWEVQARGLQLGVWSAQFSFTMASAASGIAQVSVSPSSMLNGSYATLTVALNGLAPTGGASVALTSSNAAFPVPSTLTVQAGQSSGSAEVQAGTVTNTTTVTVSATYKNTSQTTAVLQPGGATTTTLAATSVTAGAAVMNGTINPQSANGRDFFFWGTDPTLSNPSGVCGPSGCYVTANSTNQSFSATLTGLTTGATYYYRMAFYDTDNGTYQYGAITSFMTQ